MPPWQVRIGVTGLLQATMPHENVFIVAARHIRFPDPALNPDACINSHFLSVTSVTRRVNKRLLFAYRKRQPYLKPLQMTCFFFGISPVF